LNGLAHLLERQATSMTARQHEIADLLRNGLEQTEVAERLGITRQAVSKQAQSLGWKALSAGENALRVALGRFQAESAAA
jgi:DNA-binding NarL/FixJ family response regulator